VPFLPSSLFVFLPGPLFQMDDPVMLADLVVRVSCFTLFRGFEAKLSPLLGTLPFFF